jgi:hypothetical protein
MSAAQPSYELQLRALGRILDRRPTLRSEICLLQAGDGYIVNAVEARSTYNDYLYTDVTLVIEADELKAVMAELRPGKARSLPWHERG